MTQIEITLTTTIEGIPDWVELSPDGHWLAVRFEKTWSIWDTPNGICTRTFTLESQWIVVSSDGQQTATLIDTNKIVLIDRSGHEHRAILPYDINYFIFTADGRHLVIVFNDEQGIGKIALFNCNTSTIVALTDVPFNKETYTSLHPRWYGTDMALHPTTEIIAIPHDAGDSYLDTLFFNTSGSTIHLLPYSISRDNGMDYMRPLRSACFSTSGEFFAALDGPFLNIWRLPNLQLIISDDVLNTLDDDNDIKAVTFLNNHPVIVVGDFNFIHELRILSIVANKCLPLSTAYLPQPLISSYVGSYPYTMKGNTLVGCTDSKISIYRMRMT